MLCLNSQNCYEPPGDSDNELDSVEDEYNQLPAVKLSNIPIRQPIPRELEKLLLNPSAQIDDNSSGNNKSNTDIKSTSNSNNNSNNNSNSNSNSSSSNETTKQKYSVDKHLDTWNVDDDGGWGYEIEGSEYIIKMTGQEKTARMKAIKQEIDTWKEKTISSGEKYASEELIKYLKSLIYLILNNKIVGELARHHCIKAAKIAKIKGRTADGIFSRIKRLPLTENKTENATLLKLYEYVMELLKHQNVINRASSS